MTCSHRGSNRFTERPGVIEGHFRQTGEVGGTACAGWRKSDRMCCIWGSSLCPKGLILCKKWQVKSSTSLRQKEEGFPTDPASNYLALKRESCTSPGGRNTPHTLCSHCSRHTRFLGPGVGKQHAFLADSMQLCKESMSSNRSQWPNTAYAAL